MLAETRNRIAAKLEKQMALSTRHLHLGDVKATSWHTVQAEVMDEQGGVFMLLELDPDTMALIRYRRPSPHAMGHIH